MPLVGAIVGALLISIGFFSSTLISSNPVQNEGLFGAGVKLSELTMISPAVSQPTGDDLFYIVDDPGGTPVSKKITYSVLSSAISTSTRDTNLFCLADGTNCIASGGSQDLAGVTQLGSVATASIIGYGGFTGSTLAATSTLTSPSSTLATINFTHASGVTLFVNDYIESDDYTNRVGRALNLYTDSASGGIDIDTFTSGDVDITSAANIDLLATSEITINNEVSGNGTNDITIGAEDELSLQGEDAGHEIELVDKTNGAFSAGIGLRTFSERAIVFGVGSGNAGAVVTSTALWPTSQNAIALGAANLSWAGAYVSGTVVVQTDVTVGGTSVCLEDGTNCAVSAGSQTLGDTINVGSQATTTPTFHGGATFGGTLTATGTTGLQTLTFTNATGTNLSIQNVSATRFIAHESGVTVPGFTFSGDLDTGMYQNTPGLILWAINSTSELQLQSTFLGPVTNGGLSLGTSALAWQDAFVTGTGRIAQIVFSSATGSYLNVTASGTIDVLQFRNATGSNLYLSDDLAFKNATGSTISATNVSSSRFIGHAGSQSLPTYSFSHDQDTGMYNNAGDLIAWTVNGASELVLTNSILAPLTNSGLSLGSANLPYLDIFASGTVAVETDVTVNGVSVCLEDGVNCPFFSNASSTFFLSGASVLITTTPPIPTSTTVIVNSIPTQAYAFNATSTNCVYTTKGQLRGAWDAGNIRPIITWTAPTGTGAAVFRVKAQSMADNTYLGTPFTGNPSYATSTAGQGYYSQSETMDVLTVQNAAAGVPIRFEICRVGGEAGDTFGADVYIEMLAAEYLTTSYSD